MQKLERRKKYKDVEPEKTVAVIQSLLEKYGIQIKERHHHVDTADIRSCRIVMANEGLEGLEIGTNGKGMNAAYTRASAYGEFMERLANNVLLPGDAVNREGIYDLKKEEAAPLIRAYCREVFGEGETVSEYYLNEIAEERVTFQTFEEAQSHQAVGLPISLTIFLSGSNGMCAGNSREEAILQGVSEIFERYVQYELTLHPVTPPEIDKAYFEGCEVYDRLEELNRAGYRYRVLDLSLGRGFPVIGLILYHGDRYRVKLGADPSPITALERCFTEIFQGCNEIDDSMFVDVERQRQDRAAFQGSDREYWFRQYDMGISNGSGCFPMAFVREDAAPSYPFQGFEHPVSLSNADDLAYYLDIIRHNHKKLYISDRSGLGFPVYYVQIPSFSECVVKEDGGRFFVEKVGCAREKAKLTQVHSMSKEELLKLAEAVEKWFALYAPTQSYINYLYKYCDLEPFHKDKAIAYLYACGGNRKKAEAYLLRYSQTETGRWDRQLLVKKNADTASPETCFPRDRWPVCPDCEGCGVREKCRLEEIKKLTRGRVPCQLFGDENG